MAVPGPRHASGARALERHGVPVGSGRRACREERVDGADAREPVGGTLPE